MITLLGNSRNQSRDIRTRQSPKSALVLALVFFFVFPISAKEAKRSSAGAFTGYLIDLTCGRERKKDETDLGEKHTKKCMQMPICDRNGFGLLTDSNELLVFDEEGNRKVRLLLQQTNQESHLRAMVSGTKSNDVLKVSRIKLQK